MKRLAVCLALLASPIAAQDRGEWELYLTFIEPGVEPVTRLYGVMVSEAACHLAGQALALLTLQASVDLQVGVTCRLRVTA